MIFNSLAFMLFFVVVCALYFFVFKGRKAQNVLLLVASYFFYGYADLRLLPMVVVSTLVFYGLGIAMKRSDKAKKRALLSAIGVVFGVGLLVYFKYTNFFIESFADLLRGLGFSANISTLNLIAPLGISFYTFRLLSYIIDIKHGNEQATTDIVAFSTYVAFFPTILSGPIDRSITMMPQFKVKHQFNYPMAVDGMRQILWGLFKKVVIADNIAKSVNLMVLPDQSGSTILFGSVLYLFQLYADFSGYSDMAIGVGKILGFNITKNFNYPIFALNVADYWRRWHMSLTGWLTDYVFMPLSISWRNLGHFGLICSIIITFVLIGAWHGANWTFVLFGLYHGLLYIPLIISGAMFKKSKLKTTSLGLPTLRCFGQMLLTMMLVVIGLMLFRAESLSQFGELATKICSSSLFTMPEIGAKKSTLAFLVVFIVIEWITRNNEYALKTMPRNVVLRFIIYYALIMCAIIFQGAQTDFVYFQF